MTSITKEYINDNKCSENRYIWADGKMKIIATAVLAPMELPLRECVIKLLNFRTCVIEEGMAFLPLKYVAKC